MAPQHAHAQKLISSLRERERAERTGGTQCSGVGVIAHGKRRHGVERHRGVCDARVGDGRTMSASGSKYGNVMDVTYYLPRKEEKEKTFRSTLIDSERALESTQVQAEHWHPVGGGILCHQR